MRRTGLILAIVLTLTNAWAMAAPATMVQTSPRDARACCHKNTSTPNSQHDHREKSPCSGQCLMCCCRMPVTQADPPKPLLAGNAAIPLQPVIATALHTLTDPDPIFHPPRA